MATIEFTEEQTMLLETAVDFCRKNSPLDGVRRQIEQEDSVDAAIWTEMADGTHPADVHLGYSFSTNITRYRHMQRPNARCKQSNINTA